MSSITPPSCIDDGASFTKRIPRGLHPKHVSQWLESADLTSAYTGSLVDDGADMLLPSDPVPGFGPIDPRFYKQCKNKEGEDGMWTDDVQRAISGDMARNLVRMRDLGGMEVKRRDQGRSEKKDIVTVPMRLQWGTFVIKAEDGRVIVVDRDGQFDSDPREAMKKSHEGLRWIAAASTSATAPPTKAPLPSISQRHRTSQDYEKGTKSANSKRSHAHAHKHKDSHRTPILTPPLKPLAPILELEYKDGHQASAADDIMSPTQFFMTGGASGWPPRTPTSVVTDTASVATDHDSASLEAPVESKSPVNSPPGGWPSPPQSPIESVVPLEPSWGGNGTEKPWGEVDVRHEERSEKLNRSHSSGRSHASRSSRRQDFDNMSTRTYSTYRVPTVEDAPDSPSEEDLRRCVQTGWGGSIKSSSFKEERKSSKDRDTSDRTRSARALGEQRWGINDSSKEHAWKGSAQAADDESPTNNEVASEQDWGGLDRAEIAWDGYERVKTISEVSVAGTGSARSSSSNRASSIASNGVSSHCSQTGQRRRTRHAHGEDRSPRGWGGSQAGRQSWSSGKAGIDEDGWGESRDKGEGESERRRKGSYAEGDAKTSKNANGYDEDNATYLNEKWGGTPVRVGSRQSRVAGWD